MLPYNFYISAIAGGLAMVSFETIVAAKVFKHEQEMDILQGLAKGTAITLFIYLALRVGDIASNGNMNLALDGSGTSRLFMIEVIGGGVLPMILLAIPNIRKSAGSIMWLQLLVITGIVLNRFNVNFLAQGGGGATYFPSWMEIALSAGLISLLILLYRIAVIKLPVFSKN